MPDPTAMSKEVLDWQGTGPVRHCVLPNGHAFLLTAVTSQAKVYKQALRTLLTRELILTPQTGEFSVEIVIELNPDFPAIDLDNVAKAVLDGIKGHVFVDDSQVMRLLVEKRWAGQEQVIVQIVARD